MASSVISKQKSGSFPAFASNISLLEGQNRALELIIEDAPLEEVLKVLALAAEEQSANGMLASILVADEDGRHLRHGAAPSLPEAYNQAIDGIEIGPKVGSCGAAAYSKRAVIAGDISIHPNWGPFRDLAAGHDLAACWSTPILSSTKEVLGTFAMYYREPRRPAPADRETVEVITRTAALAIERKRNITRRKRDELLLLEQRNLLELIATGCSLHDCLRALCESVPRLHPRTRACVLLADAERKKFPGSVTPDALATFGAALKDAPINDLCIGTCGEAVYSGKPVTCSDVRNDEKWSKMWRDLCVSHGLLAGHSTPIMGSDGLPLGSFFLAFAEARTPNEWELKLAAFGVYIASIALERDTSNETLRESVARLRFMAESMPQKIFTAKPYGDVDYFNRQWMDFTGLSFEQIRDWGWLQFIHPDDVDENLRSWKHSVHTGQPFQLEHRFRRADGTYRWHLSRALPMRDADGKITMWVGSNTDIDDVRQAEAALRKSEKLAATGQLAATLSHEINNPMQALTNLLSLLTYKTALDNDSRALAGMAQTEVKRMAHITKQMLAFHRDSVVPVPVCVVEVLEDVLELLAIKLKGSFRVERKYEFTESIEAFPGEMRQAFLNLIGNALEVQPEGEPIYIRVAASRDWKHPERRGVRVVIVDSGSGIAAGHREHIFEPFFTTKNEKGAGLGLWVVKGIVERHSGRIHMRTTTGGNRHGTVFSVFLPLRSAAAASHPVGGKPVRHSA